MDTKALEKFCPWARLELIDAVDMRCKQFALDDDGRGAYPLGSDTINGIAGGKALTAQEKSQRDALYADIECEGYAAFCEQQAYRWFNRFAAIRYMELHGFLPNGVRMLSAPDGSFSPECLRAVDSLNLPGLDAQATFDLAMAGDDENLFRHIIVAQMNELADCLPTIFGPVSSADELTLPGNLLMRNEHNTLQHLVEDIPEDAWGNVEILGWMYQFYNSELKQAFLDSKRKAKIEDIAPATQVFTPDWIVRYMVENTLGRLWILNNPDSSLRNKMPYYIDPDGQNESFIHINGPEDITFCDPACGSGHILVYAFGLLVEMYRERGYREREIPMLVLTKNLSGIEIDERAAQIATFSLAMCACEHDKRFLNRGIVTDIKALKSIEFDTDLLPQSLENRDDLIESFSQLSEIGTLYNPSATDLAALDTAISELAHGSLFETAQIDALQTAKQYAELLSRNYDIVVANPPYMGSSRFNSFMSKWIKANYPDEKGDLCFAFINRICGMKNPDGEAGITATNSWMFLSSSEASRLKVLASNEISSLVQLSVHGYKGIAAQVFAFTLIDKQPGGYKGGYIRLNDYDHHSLQEPKTLEAIQNPDCGWFYRADASTFHDIPGSPIAYWASKAMHKAFSAERPVAAGFKAVVKGIFTGDNARFLRQWHEIALSSFTSKWMPYAKGGAFRRWSGNLEFVINWEDDAKELKSFPGSGLSPSKYFGSNLFCWSKISSSIASFRFYRRNIFFDDASPAFVLSNNDTEFATLAFLNSSVAQSMLSLIAPTLNYQAGDMSALPLAAMSEALKQKAEMLALSNIELSEADWDTQETSWGFKHNALV